MPDNYDDDNYDDDGPAVRNMRERIKQLEAEAKVGADAQAQVEAANRKLAVYEAGLNGLSEKQMKALMATADDITPDSLKAAAADLGFVKSEPAQPEPQQGNAAQADLAAFQRGAEAAAGSPPPPAAHALDQLQEMKRSLETAGPMQMASMQAEAIKAIEAAGMNVGRGFLDVVN